MSDSGLGYSDNLKAMVLARFKEGDKIYDEKFHEIFEFDLNRDFFVIANFPDRFRFATDKDVSNPEEIVVDELREMYGPAKKTIGIVRRIKPEYLGKCQASITLATAINRGEIPYDQYKAMMKYIQLAKDEIYHICFIPDRKYRQFTLLERKSALLLRVNNNESLNNGKKFPLNCVTSIIATLFKDKIRECITKKKVILENKKWHELSRSERKKLGLINPDSEP